MIQPHLAGFDSGLLNPAIHAVLEAIMRGESDEEGSSSGQPSHESKKSHHHQNFFQQLLFSLLRPPVHFLIKSQSQEKTPRAAKHVEK
jgi:hypothetical protein